MSTIIRRRSLIVAASSTLLLVAVAAALAWAGQTGPAARQPLPPPPATPEQQPDVLHGRGAQAAAEVLAVARQRLSFAVKVPAILPSGYDLALAEAHLYTQGAAVLDIVYKGPEGRQLHVFQMNRAKATPVVAPVQQSVEVSVGGSPWRYLLLAYPQPSGSVILVHFLDRFDGSVYVELDLRSVGDLEPEKASLIAAAESLQ